MNKLGASVQSPMISPADPIGEVKEVGALHFEHDSYQRFGRGPSGERRIKTHMRREHDAVDLFRKGPVTCGDRQLTL